MSQITIRQGRIDDIEVIHSLVMELAVFENAPKEVETTAKQMEVDAFGDDPSFEFLVAEDNGTVIGTAIFFRIYSTWKGKCIYLDDLIVTKERRRQGVGKLLFDELIKLTSSRGIKELHWQVLDWNEDAIEFYKKYKSHLDGEWINCKLVNIKQENEGI